MIITVKVTANARKNSVQGFQNGILKVKIQAPPDKGKANEMLIAFLAEIFQIPKQEIEILSGHTSPLKRVSLKTISSIDLKITS